AGLFGRLSETVSKLERLAKFAVVELIDTQAPQRTQPIVPVVKLFGERESRRQGRACLAGAALAVHERPAKRRRKLHAQPLGGGKPIIELCQRQPGALAAFAEQREANP